MHKPLLLALLGTFLAGCSTSPASTSGQATSDTTAMLPGGDFDEHGCKPSAGFTWSVVLNDCIRVWETGIQLKSTTPPGDATYTASVVLSDDKQQAELFIVTEKGSVLLSKADSTYTGTGYTLSQVAQHWQLSKDGKVIYGE